MMMEEVLEDAVLIVKEAVSVYLVALLSFVVGCRSRDWSVLVIWAGLKPSWLLTPDAARCEVPHCKIATRWFISWVQKGASRICRILSKYVAM